MKSAKVYEVTVAGANPDLRKAIEDKMNAILKEEQGVEDLTLTVTSESRYAKAYITAKFK